MEGWEDGRMGGWEDGSGNDGSDNENPHKEEPSMGRLDKGDHIRMRK